MRESGLDQKNRTFHKSCEGCGTLAGSNRWCDPSVKRLVRRDVIGMFLTLECRILVGEAVKKLA